MRRLLLTLAATAVAAGLIPAAAQAASGYCTPTGDYCYSAKREGGVVLLRFSTPSFNNPVKVCVRSPRGTSTCKSFTFSKGANGLWSFVRRWSKHFPNRGKGTYKVTFAALGNTLGPGATFRI